MSHSTLCIKSKLITNSILNSAEELILKIRQFQSLKHLYKLEVYREKYGNTKTGTRSINSGYLLGLELEANYLKPIINLSKNLRDYAKELKRDPTHGKYDSLTRSKVQEAILEIGPDSRILKKVCIAVSDLFKLLEKRIDLVSENNIVNRRKQNIIELNEFARRRSQYIGSSVMTKLLLESTLKNSCSKRDKFLTFSNFLQISILNNFVSVVFNNDILKNKMSELLLFLLARAGNRVDYTDRLLYNFRKENRLFTRKMSGTSNSPLNREKMSPIKKNQNLIIQTEPVKENIEDGSISGIVDISGMFDTSLDFESKFIKQKSSFKRNGSLEVPHIESFTNLSDISDELKVNTPIENYKKHPLQRRKTVDASMLSKIPESLFAKLPTFNKPIIEELAEMTSSSSLEEENLHYFKKQSLTIQLPKKRKEPLLESGYLECRSPLKKQRSVDIDSLFDDFERLTTSDPGANQTQCLNYLGHSKELNSLTLADFEFVRILGQGAYGKVFLGKKTATGDLYALKILGLNKAIDKKELDHIVAEREVFCRINGTFCVNALGTFLFQNLVCFVIEYVPGGDLYQQIFELDNFSLTSSTIVLYLAELVLGIEELHSQGIVHRDIKPQNILIDNSGHLKLTDYGLSDVTGRISSSFAKGSLNYMAPENFIGSSLGFEVDWWALGILAFFLIKERYPFVGETKEEMIQSIISYRIEWNQDGIYLFNLDNDEDDEDFIIDGDLLDLISKLLEFEPSRRLGSKGAWQIKKHPFFRNINWSYVAEKKYYLYPPILNSDEERKTKGAQLKTMNSYILEKFAMEIKNSNAINVENISFNKFDLFKIESLISKNQQISKQIR